MGVECTLRGGGRRREEEGEVYIERRGEGGRRGNIK